MIRSRREELERGYDQTVRDIKRVTVEHELRSGHMQWILLVPPHPSVEIVCNFCGEVLFEGEAWNDSALERLLLQYPWISRVWIGIVVGGLLGAYLSGVILAKVIGLVAAAIGGAAGGAVLCGYLQDRFFSRR